MDIEKVIYMLMVSDLDRAVDFYTGTIGFSKRSVSPYWSELMFGDFTLTLHHGGTTGTVKTGLSFTVGDIDAACADVAAAGGKVVKEPYASDVPGLRLAAVSDWAGNVLEFGQHID